jgi:hypothetical protein
VLDPLRDGELLDGWRHPGAFRRLVARGLLPPEPRHVLAGNRLRRAVEMLECDVGAPEECAPACRRRPMRPADRPAASCWVG